MDPKELGLEVFGPSKESLVSVKAIADEICARVNLFPTKAGWTLHITEYNIKNHGSRLIDKAREAGLSWNEISSTETTTKEGCGNAIRKTAVSRAA